MSKNRKSKISSLPVFIILILILDLAFLYFIKYQNQSLSIVDFSLYKFGNLCNLFFTLILIIGIIILILKNDLFFETKKILPVFILNQSIIVIIFFSRFISLPFKEIYYLGQTGDELLIGAMFILYTFTYLVMIYLVWLNIFRIKNIIVVRATLNSVLSLMFFLFTILFYIIGKEAEFDDKLIDTNGKNVGVVLGAAVWSGNKPSPSLIGRVDKALLLYKTDKISQIYLTGSNAPGELTESEVAFKYLKNKDVETSKIFLEKETTSTNEQIQYIKKNLIPKSNSKIVVISDSYHLVRVIEIAKFHNIEIQVSASELAQSFEKALYNKLREASALMVFWLFAI
jgi:vancomycin permeability regulator SanA